VSGDLGLKSWEDNLAKTKYEEDIMRNRQWNDEIFKNSEPKRPSRKEKSPTRKTMYFGSNQEEDFLKIPEKQNTVKQKDRVLFLGLYFILPINTHYVVKIVIF
jgi:hypothetical protein